MKLISGIYKIQSISHPERSYIGSAVNIGKRWNHHIADLRKGTHHSSKLQNHFNKHGESDLQFGILLGCEKELLLDNEQFFLDSYKPYFNIYQTTRQYSTEKQSKESNEKRRKSMTGKKWSEESKKRFSELCKGRPKSEEHKRKLSKALMGNKPAPKSPTAIKRMSESRKGAGNPMFGKDSWNKGKHTMTEEQKEKLRAINTGRPAWNTGKKMTDESRKKMSQSALGKKRTRTPEHQHKLSESRKRNNLLRKMISN